MMPTANYQRRRFELEEYFDRTAVEAWKRLTSDAPVSGIRATVRAGRDRMRACLLGQLPADLSGRSILDAGCGTGAMSVELARRGANVVAVDISPKLVDIARERLPDDIGSGSIRFEVGDMLTAACGGFDHVVAMDSLIHYRAGDMVRVLDQLGCHAGRSVVFTFAPSTPALIAMHTVGRLFPRGDRAPAIEPVSHKDLSRRIERSADLAAWRIGMSERIVNGFYTSQAMELVRR